METVLITGIKQDGSSFNLNVDPNAEEISLSKNSLAKLDLSFLSRCTQVKTLNLGVNPLMEIDIAPIENLSNLQFLSIVRAMLAEIDLSPLKHCPNLEYLSLTSNSLSYLDLTPLENCNQLRSLSLSDNKIRKIDLSILSGKKNLASFGLSGNLLTDIDLSPLSECMNLISIFFVGNQLSTIDLEPLSNCKNLKTIMISKNNINEIDLNPLEGIEAVEITIDEAVNIIGNPVKAKFAKSSNFGGMDEDEAKSWNFIKEGNRLLSQGNLTTVTNIFEKAFRLAPRNAKLRISAAFSFSSRREFESAFDTLYVLIEDGIPLDAETKGKLSLTIQNRQRELMQERLRSSGYDPEEDRFLFQEMIFLHLINRLSGEDIVSSTIPNRNDVEEIIGSEWMDRYDKAYGSPDETWELYDTVLELVNLAHQISPKDSEVTEMENWFDLQTSLWNDGKLPAKEFKKMIVKYQKFVNNKLEPV